MNLPPLPRPYVPSDDQNTVDLFSADQLRQAQREAVAAAGPEWLPVDTAPYETNVLTFWPGSKTRNPVYLITKKNSGQFLGKRDSWWDAQRDQMPTHWVPLPAAPEVEQ